MMRQVNVIYRICDKTNQPYAILARSDALTAYPYMDALTFEKWPCDPMKASQDEIVTQSVHATWYRQDTRGIRHGEIKAFHWHVWRHLLSLGYEPEQIKCRQRLPPYRHVFKDYEDA